MDALASEYGVSRQTIEAIKYQRNWKWLNGPDLSLRFAQGEVFQDRARFRVLVAGRRFGNHIYRASNYYVERSKSQVRTTFIALRLSEWRKISFGRL